MGFSEAVQWWEEWQLRLLALTSLFIQCFLFLAAPMRKCCIPSVLRFLIWIAFLGSDAVAAYALATLFNRHKKSESVSTHRDSANLEALWAPILLLHLAGQDSITAYNIEDNELWRRHVVSRGQWTLQRDRCDRKKMMKSSLRRPFDESVLLWHLATDLCFHHRADGGSSSPSTTTSCDASRRRRSREISNYMVYLLFANPEMLMPGARSSLFRDFYKQLKGMPLDDNGEEEELAQQIMLTKDLEAPEGSGLVHKACALAQELLEIGKDQDEDKMWEVIQGVWVEMLCFSAARCRGYLHAKSMGRGGEYLTYVWLLLLNMGMEPLSERMQRTETEEKGGGGDAAAASPASAPQETDIVED